MRGDARDEASGQPRAGKEEAQAGLHSRKFLVPRVCLGILGAPARVVHCHLPLASSLKDGRAGRSTPLDRKNPQEQRNTKSLSKAKSGREKLRSREGKDSIKVT